MNGDKKALFRETIRRINTAANIAIICHRKPDGDALGSLCAIKILLEKLKKPHQAFCIDDVPEYLKFLPRNDKIRRDFHPKQFDLIITLDCGADYMTGYLEKFPDLFNNKSKTINIDHHPSNNNFGEINLVDVHSASTSIIIFDLLQFARFEIDPDLATALLTGIYTDTGSFMHSNTSSDVYLAASQLLKRGGKLSLIIKNAFKTTPLNILKLWGRILNSLKINEEGITIAVATEDDFRQTGTKPDEISGIIDLLNTIPNTKFSVLLNEDGRGNVKGSFRTQNENINLSKIAGIFGGGGHKKAAGFTIPGKLEKEVRWKIVKEEK